MSEMERTCGIEGPFEEAGASATQVVDLGDSVVVRDSLRDDHATDARLEPGVGERDSIAVEQAY